MIEALKRIVDKFKAENDRLRRGAAEGAMNADTDRRLKEQKQRIAELSDQLATFKTK